MTSPFDPAAFLDATTTEASTRRNPLPTGHSYVALIGEITSRQWTGRADPTKTGIALDVELVLEIPPEIQEAEGYTTSTFKLKDSIMLDLNATGGIDFGPGKKGRLRSYREATGLNSPGVPFKARDLTGKTILVQVKHRLVGDAIYEDVGAVAAA